MEDSTILIIGSGAREDTLSKIYEKSHDVKKIIVSPGNDFIKHKRKKEVITDKNCSLKDPSSLLEIAKKYKPDLVDVAQDDALASGTIDMLEDHGFPAFGPNKKSSRIEWDKKWSREFMQRHEIPHPNFRYFDNEDTGKEYVRELYNKDSHKLIYVKATGLCGGKGAPKASNLEEAIKNIELMKKFPNGAGKIFLIEEGLEGEEFSYYAISDGDNYKLFKSAQDNKTLLNFDEGDQTGGMGVISPALVTKSLENEIEKELIAKAIKGMALENNSYRGVLYLGGILVNGKLLNIEYNTRWGDPECQAVLPSLQNDYFEIVKSTLNGKLNERDIIQDNKTRVCIVGASKGYPNDYSKVKGKRIYGLEEAMKIEGITVFGAGIDVIDSKFYANGGRLFSVVAEGQDVIDARQRAYSAISMISIVGNNLHYRIDIGWRDADRLRNLD